MKFGETRIQDALDYLTNSGFANLANDLQTLLAQQSPSARVTIAKELSLGSRNDDKDEPAYAGNTQQRQAVRALLLCQRVYFSTLWAPVERRPANWKSTSFAYWRDKTEIDVQAGISTFTAPSSLARDAADVAEANSNNEFGYYNLSLSRASPNFPINDICYTAVMSWLFRSGLVSYRWMLKHLVPSNENQLRVAFGDGQVIWAPGETFEDGDSLQFVPKGHIVHLFMPPNFNGHWMISNGDGTATGCNNDEEGGAVNRIYSTSCNLDAQFRLGFAWLYYDGATSLKLDVPKKMPGKAVVIDPTLIPGRD